MPINKKWNLKKIIDSVKQYNYLDKTPIVIKQDRVGLHGKIFKMYKFRTMKNNSHKDEGEDKLNHVIIKDGMLLQGRIDKKVLSSGTRGLVHVIKF